MRFVILLLALAAAACATADDTKEVMDRYRSQPIDAVVARLGMPQGEQTIMGRKAYSWTRTTSDVETIPALTTGTIGNASVLATTYTTESYSTTCTLRVLVDGANRITGYDLNGQAGACRAIGARLR